MEAVFPFSTKADFQGVPSSRVYRPYNAFEAVLDGAIGDRVRADGACGIDLWCALANLVWRGPDGAAISYSFRRAGEVVAWVREGGDYLTWYCSGQTGTVSDWIADSLIPLGWSWAEPPDTL